MSERDHPVSVDAVLRSQAGKNVISRFGLTGVSEVVRCLLAFQRQSGGPFLEAEAVAEQAMLVLNDKDLPSQRPVLNLTGTVLHTNLGRAVLAQEAIDAAVAAMAGPTNLEFSLNAAARGERDDHVKQLICELTGAQDACLVNNNAAAVFLVLATHAKNRQTIVSRGELIEIGGAFRLPDIMARAGTGLVEVGTTNCTHARDYEAAITTDTGLLLKAHTSNFAVVGFTKAVSASSLAEIGRAKNIPLFVDLGSGTLIDLSRYGLGRERTVQDALAQGADLVSFSGDKLLGGPQCGFIVGRADLVRQCAKNPLKRTLRLDKIRLAALEATLKLYRNPDQLAQRLPTLRWLSRPSNEIFQQAERLAPFWQSCFASEQWQCGVKAVQSQIGSGALPLDRLDSAALFARPIGKSKGHGLETASDALRALPIPVLGRIADNALLLDLRCLDRDEDLQMQISQLPPLKATGK